MNSPDSNFTNYQLLLSELGLEYAFKGRLADLLQFVTHALVGLVDFDDAGQVDRGADDDHIDIGGGDGFDCERARVVIVYKDLHIQGKLKLSVQILTPPTRKTCHPFVTFGSQG